MTPSLPMKATALLLSAAYLGTNCLFAHGPESNLWDQRRAARTASFAQAPAAPLALPLAAAALPPGAAEKHAAFLSALDGFSGRLRKFSGPADGPLVVHIQDVHQNADAQKNIGAAVGRLMESGAALVALEGASDVIDVERFRRFPHKDTVRKVADYLLREHRISGPVRAAFLQPRPVPVVGVETEGLYQSNIEAYRRAAPRLSAARDWAAARCEALAREKLAVYNPALRALDAAVESYHAGGPLLAYASALIGAAPGPLPEAVAVFDRAMALEKTIRFEQVERERAALVERLGSALSAAETRALAGAGLAYRAGALPYGEFYARLAALCARKGVPLADFPEMEKYVRYVLLCDRVPPEALFEGLAGMEKAALAARAIVPAERALVARSRGAALTAKLVEFSLTPAEWAEYQAGPRPDGFALGDFEDFYRQALARDVAMAENLLRAWKKSDGPVVLVTGGFHAPGLERALLDRGAAVATFVPRVEALEPGGRYLSVFTQEKTPLDKLFQGQKLFLAQRPLAPAAPAEGAVAAVADRVRAGQDAAQAAAEIGARIDGAALSGGAVTVDLGRAAARVSFRADGEIAAVAPLPGADRLNLPAAIARAASWARVFLDISGEKPSGVRKGREEFADFLDRVKGGRIEFPWDREGGLLAKPAGHDPAFGAWFDRWIMRLQDHRLRHGRVSAEDALLLGEALVTEPDAAPLPAGLAAALARFRTLAGLGRPVPEELDDLVAAVERDVRAQLRVGAADSAEAARAAWEMDRLLAPQGYGIELNPRGLQDERLLILLRIAEESFRETDEGPVTVQEVVVVTRFAVEGVRLAAGWSPFFSPVVRVQPALIRADEVEAALRPRPASGPAAALRDRLARLALALNRRGLWGQTAQGRYARRAEAVISHEVEHERRRRKLGLLEGDDIHVGLEEELAELRSMQEGEPFHVLARLATLAGAAAGGDEDLDFAWSVLSRITGVSADRPEALAGALEALAENAGEARLGRMVDAAYAAAEKDWESVNARKIKRRAESAGMPGAGVLARLFKNPNPRLVAGLETAVLALVYPLALLFWSDQQIPRGLEDFSRAAALATVSTYLGLVGYHLLGIQKSAEEWIPAEKVTFWQAVQAANTASLSLIFIPFMLMTLYFKLPFFAAIGMIGLGLFIGHTWHGGRSARLSDRGVPSPSPTADAARVPLPRLSSAALLTTHPRWIQPGKEVRHRARFRDFPEGGRSFTLQVGQARYRVTAPEHGAEAVYGIEILTGRAKGRAYSIAYGRPHKLALPDGPGQIQFLVPRLHREDIVVRNLSPERLLIQETFPAPALATPADASPRRAQRPEELIRQEPSGEFSTLDDTLVVNNALGETWRGFGNNFWAAYAHAFLKLQDGRPEDLRAGKELLLSPQEPRLLEFRRPASGGGFHAPVRLLMVPWKGHLVALVQPETGDYTILSKSDAKQWTLADPGPVDGHQGNFFIGWGTAWQTGVGPELFRARNNSGTSVRIYRLAAPSPDPGDAALIGKRAFGRVEREKGEFYIDARFSLDAGGEGRRIPLKPAEHAIDVAADLGRLSRSADLEEDGARLLAFVAQRVRGRGRPALFTFSEDFADLHGLAARRPASLIALHESLLGHGGARRMAVLHEAMHWLILQNRLRLRLVESSLEATLLSPGGNEVLLLPLTAEGLELLRGKPFLDHYLIRALQRTLFPDEDRALSGLIRQRRALSLVREVHPLEAVNPHAARMEAEVGPILAALGLLRADDLIWEPVQNRLSGGWDWLARRAPGKSARSKGEKRAFLFNSLLKRTFLLNVWQENGVGSAQDRQMFNEMIDGVAEGALVAVVEQSRAAVDWNYQRQHARGWLARVGFPQGLGAYLATREGFSNAMPAQGGVVPAFVPLRDGYRLYLFRRAPASGTPALIGKSAVVPEVLEHGGRLYLDARRREDRGRASPIALLPARRALAFGWDLWFLDLKWGGHSPAGGLLREAARFYHAARPGVFTFREGFADLHGVSALVPRPLVAIHAALLDYDAPRRVALLHEVLHLLMAKKRLHMELVGGVLRVTYLNQAERVNRFMMVLDPEALALVEGRAQDEHYLLRAFQRQAMPRDDRALTDLILRRPNLRYPEDPEAFESLDPYMPRHRAAVQSWLRTVHLLGQNDELWEPVQTPRGWAWQSGRVGAKKEAVLFYSVLQRLFRSRIDANALPTEREKKFLAEAIDGIPRGTLVVVVDQHREFINWNGRGPDALRWSAALGFPQELGEYLASRPDFKSQLRGGRGWVDLRDGYRLFILRRDGSGRRTPPAARFVLAAGLGLAAWHAGFGSPEAVLAAAGFFRVRPRPSDEWTGRFRRLAADLLDAPAQHIAVNDRALPGDSSRRVLTVVDRRAPSPPRLEVRYKVRRSLGRASLEIDWQVSEVRRRGLMTLADAYLSLRHGAPRLTFMGLQYEGRAFVMGLVRKGLVNPRSGWEEENVTVSMPPPLAARLLELPNPREPGEGRPLSILDPVFRAASARAAREGRARAARLIEAGRRGWNVSGAPLLETFLFFAWPAGAALPMAGGIVLFAAAHLAVERWVADRDPARAAPEQAGWSFRLSWGAVFALPFVPLLFGVDFLYEGFAISALLHALRNVRAAVRRSPVGVQTAGQGARENPEEFGRSLAQAAAGEAPGNFSRRAALAQMRDLIPVEGPLLEDMDGGFVQGFRAAWGARPATEAGLQSALLGAVTPHFAPGSFRLGRALRAMGAEPRGLHVVVLPPAEEVSFDLRSFVQNAIKISGRRPTLFLVPNGRAAHYQSNEAMEFAAQVKARAPYSRGIIPAAAVENVGGRWVLRVAKMGKVAEAKPAIVSLPDLYLVDTTGAADGWRGAVILFITSALRAMPIRFLDLDSVHRAARAIAAAA